MSSDNNTHTIESFKEATDFIDKINRILEIEYGNDEFEITTFALHLYISRSQLHRPLHKYFACSTSAYIRNFRLAKAKNKLLNDVDVSIGDVASSCGFKDVKYFSTVFRQRYSVPPSRIASICNVE